MTLWKELKAYAKDDAGMGTVEIILIIVVLVGLVLIFKKQITEMLTWPCESCCMQKSG